ncbi:nucleoporin NDC1-like [Bombus terrestris]|uniref:Nucleoporin NDC1-like n=1 Tax=Bombus terrestris TaxID=30195 RepID=A0A9C6SJ21_BOMTE|nr:nucleoporin NDC1-like [Bombus terrestris]XP_048261582.1 nucleoporin NDC1-like [Bombus terrestris]
MLQQQALIAALIEARIDKARRGVLFTLSQPGGHPYNWNCVVEKCTGLIKKFSDDLSTACIKPQEPKLPLGVPSSTMTDVSAFQKQYIYQGGKVCHILFNGQTIIWAADAISSLAVLSLNEDSYGIAQKDLPLIINTLLALKQALDKLQKSNIMTKKQHGDDKFIKQIFHSLRAAAKRSLYRIVTCFEIYIGDLGLETTTVEQLHSFLAYRE